MMTATCRDWHDPIVLDEGRLAFNATRALEQLEIVEIVALRPLMNPQAPCLVLISTEKKK